MSHVTALTRANILLGSKSGRDKLYKTLQYLLKLALEFALAGSIEHPLLPYLKRFSLRLSQSRALFRLGSFLADFERLEILVTKEILSWAFLEKLITLFNVFVSNLFDSVVTVNGIIRRDTSFSLHYSTLFWLLGIIGDTVRYSRGLHHALRSEAKWKKENSASLSKSPEGEPSHSTPEVDIKIVREAKWENIVGIFKTLCDSVTALSILYPVEVGRYRMFVCSCGLFAGSVGLVQNWVSIKA
jgi:hypothetical protein